MNHRTPKLWSAVTWHSFPLTRVSVTNFSGEPLPQAAAQGKGKAVMNHRTPKLWSAVTCHSFPLSRVCVTNLLRRTATPGKATASTPGKSSTTSAEVVAEAEVAAEVAVVLAAQVAKAVQEAMEVLAVPEERVAEVAAAELVIRESVPVAPARSKAGSRC